MKLSKGTLPCHKLCREKKDPDEDFGGSGNGAVAKELSYTDDEELVNNEMGSGQLEALLEGENI